MYSSSAAAAAGAAAATRAAETVSRTHRSIHSRNEFPERDTCDLHLSHLSFPLAFTVLHGITRDTVHLMAKHLHIHRERSHTHIYTHIYAFIQSEHVSQFHELRNTQLQKKNKKQSKHTPYSTHTPRKRAHVHSFESAFHDACVSPELSQPLVYIP